MNLIQEQQKHFMLEKLQTNLKISKMELQEIIDSLQIPTGSATGVGKVKGILECIKISPVNIMGEQISDKYQLSELIHSIDNNINIASDGDFKDYF
jgi:hypothetical protein